MSYIQSLTVFSYVAEEGSFSAAARKLKLTQPTISFHIDNLEKNFGCPLFARTSKGVTLTIYGERLYETTKTINDLVAETHQEIQAMAEGSAGRIIVGASTIPADYILPPLIAKFLQAHTGLAISLVTGDSQTVLEKYNQGEVAIAIIGIKPDDSLPSYPLWKDNLVLAAHPDFLPATYNTPANNWLLTVPFVMRKKSSGTTRSALAYLSRLGINSDKLLTVMEADSNQAAKAAIIHKVGVGFISAWAIKSELNSRQLISLPLPKPAVERQFYAISRQPLRPACLNLFWQFLLSQ